MRRLDQLPVVGRLVVQLRPVLAGRRGVEREVPDDGERGVRRRHQLVCKSVIKSLSCAFSSSKRIFGLPLASVLFGLLLVWFLREEGKKEQEEEEKNAPKGT